MFICLKCGSRENETEKCAKCGRVCINISINIETNIDEDCFLEKEKKKIFSITDVLGNKNELQEIDGFGFLGQVPQKFSAMIYGIPGSGKSTFSMRFFDKISNRKSIYFSSEESVESATMQKKIKDNNMVSPNIFFSYSDKWQDLLNLVKEEKPHNLAIDSINAIGAKPKDIKKVAGMIDGILLIVLHCTKDNKYKGDSSFAHDVDIVLKAVEGKVSNKKNRFFFSQEEYLVFDIESSIEGEKEPIDSKQNEKSMENKGNW